VKIVVEIVPKDENTFLEIQVIDTGIGIKEEDQDKLFKLFGFVQDTKNLNKNGIGLGLAISDEIV
jgi:signal transduction histidine kinase